VLTETVHAPGTLLARHEHANPNVNFVLHGSFGEQVEGRDLCCEPGTVLVKPAGASHANRYGLGLAHSLIVEFCPVPGSATAELLPRLDLWHSRDTIVAGLGWRLYQEMLESDGVTPLSIGETLAELLHLIAAGHARDSLRVGQPAWLRRVRERLDEATDVELESLVSEAGVHPRHVLRTFRRYVGCSMGEYARRRRIRRAQRLLAEAELTVAAIAVEAGFCDQSHFTRVFRRCTGMTPAAYRRLASGVRCCEDTLDLHRSTTISRTGRAQHTSTLPSAGGSSGAGS
jgi:AraC family transcriptional regulator